MFKSEGFPLGPNGQFPKQRIDSFGNMLIPGVSMQDTYLNGGSTVSKLPNLERDFDASNKKVKGRLTKNGKIIRSQRKKSLRPRYALRKARGSGVSGYDNEFGYEFEKGMDDDPTYDSSGHRMDEGEVDDSVGSIGYYP